MNGKEKRCKEVVGEEGGRTPGGREEGQGACRQEAHAERRVHEADDSERRSGGRDWRRADAAYRGHQEDWEYIKKNKLQDAKNRRNINADAKLKVIFKKPTVSMFDMTKLVSAHLK